MWTPQFQFFPLTAFDNCTRVKTFRKWRDGLLLLVQNPILVRWNCGSYLWVSLCLIQMEAEIWEFPPYGQDILTIREKWQLHSGNISWGDEITIHEHFISSSSPSSWSWSSFSSSLWSSSSTSNMTEEGYSTIRTLLHPWNAPGLTLFSFEAGSSETNVNWLQPLKALFSYFQRTMECKLSPQYTSEMFDFQSSPISNLENTQHSAHSNSQMPPPRFFR